MALGAIQALKSAGMKPGKDVMVGSIDGQKAALEAIIRGELGVSVESNPRFGPLVFATMEKYFAGKKIPPSGKSTLIKIMTGAYRWDSGVMEYDQKNVAFQNPMEAQAAGIVAVYQEIQLVSLRTVAENIFLGRELHRFGIIDRRAMNARATDILERLGLHIDPHSVVGSLNIAHRQMVAIARAISFGARVLILDEPTSSLTETEVSVLFDVNSTRNGRRCRSSGSRRWTIPNRAKYK